MSGYEGMFRAWRECSTRRNIEIWVAAFPKHAEMLDVLQDLGLAEASYDKYHFISQMLENGVECGVLNSSEKYAIMNGLANAAGFM